MTGYRRRGTRLAELRRHFEQGITASAILEPLRNCPAHADAQEMARMLADRDFDMAGIQDTPDSPVQTYVLRDQITGLGPVQNYAIPLVADVLIADSTPLPEVLKKIVASKYAFVMVGPFVRGIITEADLNKPPVRIFLFGILSMIEMHITFWIRSELSQDDWKPWPHQQQIKKAESLQARKAEKGHDTDLLDCLSLGDKRVILAHSEKTRLAMGLALEDVQALSGVEELRNDLSHSYADLAAERSWADIVGVVAIVERIVKGSDDAIERLAQARSVGYQDSLWASA